MEANSSNEFNDEPNPKRPKMESEVSTSSKPEAKDPFLSMPQDALVKIIASTPIAQWTSLELLDTNFQTATRMAWRQLRSINLERELSIKCSSFTETIASVNSILHKLAERSPFLTSLHGIHIEYFYAAFNYGLVTSLAQFEHLESLTLGDEKLYNDRRGGISLDAIVEFLQSTQSRPNLKELRVHHVVQRRGDRATILDRFASALVDGHEIRSPLRLEKLVITSFDSSLRIPLDTLDTSRLTDVRLRKASIEPQHLTNLIERATTLEQIELSFVNCPPQIPCDNLRLQANKKLLMALGSHENLTAITFDYVEDFECDSKCMRFGREFNEMLKMIGRRGILRKLALEEEYFVHPPGLDTNEVCATIHDCIPNLRTIKVCCGHYSQGSVSMIVGLTELEELCLTRLVPSSVTANAIAQLPHLKRLALARCTDWLRCFANSTTLTDLRIRYCDTIGETSGDVLPSNLEILMLGTIGMNEENGLVRLLKKAVGLRVLILDGYVTDRSLMAVARSCPNLEIFGVHSYSNITAHRLQRIVDRCTKLKRMGGFEDEVRDQLQFPKYRKISNVDTNFWIYDFDDDEYVS